MKLTEITQRSQPLAWVEGDNIPWNEPGFSERMLKEHLSQNHDAASRRTATIQCHVDWIFETLLCGNPAAVLDLGCGPGLYTSRLARKGCTCTGIDFSPASIQYARATATSENLACRYEQADLRSADFGEGYAIAMLIFGEFNVFKPDEAALILRKAWAALQDGGTLLLEVSPLASIEAIGRGAASWSAAPAGLFSAQPHLLLEESFWDESARTATTRYYLIDAASAAVTRHSASYQGYPKEALTAHLASCGFTQVRFFPALASADPSAPDTDFIAITAHKPALPT